MSVKNKTIEYKIEEREINSLDPDLKTIKSWLVNNCGYRKNNIINKFQNVLVKFCDTHYYAITLYTCERY